MIDEYTLEALIDIFGENQIEDALIDGDFEKYQKNPIAFFEDVLKIKIIPPDLIKIAKSIRDNKITVCQSATGTGKTFLAACAALWHYKCFPKSQTILVAAPPESNLKEKVWSEVADLVLKNRKLFHSDKILTLKITDDIDLNKKGIDAEDEESGKHFITGKTIPTNGSAEERESKFSGQHADYLFFINDESDAIPNEVFKGEDGCLSGDGSRQLNLFNPKRKSGWVYDLIKNGKANVIVMSAFNHPNVITGENLISGAVSRDKTIERIWDWTAPLREDEEPDAQCFEIPDFLVGAVAEKSSGGFYEPLQAGWRRIVNSAFSYKVLGVYPSSTENSLISEIWIDAAVSRWKLYVAEYGDDAIKGLNCVLGVDIADQGADSCCAAKKYGNFVAGFEMWKGIDLDLSSDKLANIYTNLDAYQANVEADGIGAAIPPKVSRMFYWKCKNPECSAVDKTYLNENMWQCPVCHKDLKKKHFSVKKVYVSSPSTKKCDFGRFALLRDQLAWEVANWLEKEPSAMLPDDPELREQLLAYEFYEDQNSGKIKVSDKLTVKKRISGNSDDKFAALRQCFYEPTVPRIRVI